MVFVWILLGSLAGMVAVNVWLGLNEPAEIESLEAAVDRIDTDSVGFAAGEGVLAADHKAALVEEAGSERLALVVARNDSHVIRYLTPGAVRGARMGENATVTLRLNDFTFPATDLAFADGSEARHWADRLNALQG
mgnify:CR=1 FL=1